MLDADQVAVSNPDELFNISAPAGICSTIADNQQETMNSKKLTVEQVNHALDKQYGIRGCCMVLKPSTIHYKFVTDLLHSRGSYGNPRRFVGADEALMSELYLDEWTHISNKYGINSWKAKELKDASPVFLHFVTEKVIDGRFDFAIWLWCMPDCVLMVVVVLLVVYFQPWSPVGEWDDFKVWNFHLLPLLEQHPGLTSVYQAHLDFMKQWREKEERQFKHQTEESSLVEAKTDSDQLSSPTRISSTAALSRPST